MMPILGIKKKLNKALGFTLLELLVVLSIIALVTALFAPDIRNNEYQKFDSKIRQAAALLKYARRVSIVKSSPQTVSFIILNSSDKNSKGVNTVKQKTSSDVLAWGSDEISFFFQANEDQYLEEISFLQVIFFPEGGSTGGRLTFQQADMTASINIDAITGRITSFFLEDESRRK